MMPKSNFLFANLQNETVIFFQMIEISKKKYASEKIMKNEIIKRRQYEKKLSKNQMEMQYNFRI